MSVAIDVAPLRAEDRAAWEDSELVPLEQAERRAHGDNPQTESENKI